MTTKKDIWNKIKERAFDFANKDEIFSIIENHLERIEFVKDHIGLRDFLFIAEEGTEDSYVSNLFIATDVNASKHATMQENNQEFGKKVNEDPIEVLKELKLFLSSTQRPLYLGVGFIETISKQLRDTTVEVETFDGIQEISLLDAKIIGGIQSGKYKSAEEALKDLREFPHWYTEVSVMPEETKQLTIEEERALKIEERRIQMEEYKNAIDEALDEQNKEKFLQYSKLLNELKEISM